MTPGRLKIWNEAAGEWQYVAAGGGSQPGSVVLAVRTFTETAGAGIYTATVDLPANAQLMRMYWNTPSDWGTDAGGDADLVISDEGGILYSDSVEGSPDVLVISYLPENDTWSTGTRTETGKLYASGQTITITITSAAATGTGTGVISLKYAVDPDTAAAVKS